ncbi:hypothetical protein RFI_37409, partial [Reticulomyxa filosa]
MSVDKSAEDRLYSYDYRDVHKDLEAGKVAGAYGWDHACYHAIAEKKAGVDMSEFHSKRSKSEQTKKEINLFFFENEKEGGKQKKKIIEFHSYQFHVFVCLFFFFFLQFNLMKLDECYVPEVQELLENADTQKHWKKIVTFDPWGMTATTPTIAGTTAYMNVPELTQLHPDGKIVNEDGSVNTTKVIFFFYLFIFFFVCVCFSLFRTFFNNNKKKKTWLNSGQYAWNLPALANRLELTEDEFRDALYKYTKNGDLKDKSIRTFLPQVGGLTCYFFGDPRKIRNKKCEVAVRVHDECNGSDVFGTDICTCRPYLVFALQSCIECAQSGGVGV